MEITNVLLLLGIGACAGFINTFAGGGSLLTLPILIFMGLDPAMANGTNRVSIFLQNIFGVRGFQSKGVSAWPYSLYMGLSALGGAFIGARIAIDISGELFNKILGVVMILVIILTVFKPKGSTEEHVERMGKKHQIIGGFVFFLIGIYGGFIQAGVGFLIIAALTTLNRFSLVKTNAAKMMVVLIYTVIALGVFIYEDKVDWTLGLTLACGTSMGAWFGSRWSVKAGEKWIKIILVIAVVAMAAKLWFPELFELMLPTETHSPD